MEDKRRHIESNERKWDSRAEAFERKWFNRFNYFQFLQKRVIHLLDLHEGQRFLDIGCGTGWAVRYAASLVKNEGGFYGIDISSRMIEKAQESCSGCESIYFYKADAEALPFENDLFDFIICTNSFHHYFTPSKMLNEVYRVLKTGGRILILDPTADAFLMKMYDKWTKKRESEHVKYYSTQEYRKLLAQARLNYVSSRPIWPLLRQMKVHIGAKS